MSQAAAKRYAEALFELSNEHDALDAVSESLLRLRQRLADNTTVSAALFSSKSAVDEKKKLVADKLAEGLHDYVRNLLNLLCDRRREGALMALLLHFFELKEEKSGIVRMTVESARPMDDAARQKLEASLSEATKKSVQLEVEVVPELIGGLRLTVGSTRIDGSIKRKYEDLGTRLRVAI